MARLPSKIKSGLHRLRPGILLVVTALICAVNVSFAGRGDKTGTASAPELLIPIGARSIGLGTSSLAVVDGLEALYWNPAGMIRTTSTTELLFSHMAYLADIGVDYVALSTSMGDLGRIGFSIKSISIGDIPVTTEDQPDGTGEIASPTFIVASGAFARHITDRISVGFSANVLYEKMANVTTSGIAFTGGVQYTGLGGIDGLGVGVVIRNIGPSLTFGGTGLLHTAQVNDATRDQYTILIDAAPADLPSTIELGVAYSMDCSEDARLVVTSTFQNNNYSNDEYKIGTEYSFRQMLFVRGGYMFSSSTSDEEYIYGPTAGIGVRAKINEMNVHVDYGYRSAKYFGGNSVFTVGLDF